MRRGKEWLKPYHDLLKRSRTHSRWLKLVEMTPEMIEKRCSSLRGRTWVRFYRCPRISPGLEKELGSSSLNAEVGKKVFSVCQDDGPICFRTAGKSIMGKIAFCFPGQLQEKPNLEDHHPLKETPILKHGQRGLP